MRIAPRGDFDARQRRLRRGSMAEQKNRQKTYEGPEKIEKSPKNLCRANPRRDFDAHQRCLQHGSMAEHKNYRKLTVVIKQAAKVSRALTAIFLSHPQVILK